MKLTIHLSYIIRDNILYPVNPIYGYVLHVTSLLRTHCYRLIIATFTTRTFTLRMYGYAMYTGCTFPWMKYCPSIPTLYIVSKRYAQTNMCTNRGTYTLIILKLIVLRFHSAAFFLDVVVTP
jgi:hypothetical protein